MDDFTAKLKGDLIEQFRGKPNIAALLEAIGAQLQAVAQFFDALRTQRAISTSVGAQLDGVGDIVVLSRAQAGQLASVTSPGEAITDDTYRKYLIYKVLKNTNICTYPEIIQSFQMFWEKPLFYEEDPERPATMIFHTGVLRPEDRVENLLQAPIIRAAGVGVKVIATTESPQRSAGIQYGGRFFSITDTQLPEYQMNYDFQTEMHLGTAFQSISQTTLPKMNDV